MLDVLYTAIAAELLAINAYVVPTTGAGELSKNDPPPRMIFVERADEFLPVEGPGGNPRPLHTVLETSDLILLGQTREIVQGMRDQFVIAFHRACKKANQGNVRAGRYTLSSGKWMRTTLLARNGFEYRLVFGIAVPIILRTAWDSVRAPTTADFAEGQTYPTVPGDELTIQADVGVRDEPPAEDNVGITIPTPPEEPPPDP